MQSEGSFPEDRIHEGSGLIQERGGATDRFLPGAGGSLRIAGAALGLAGKQKELRLPGWIELAGNFRGALPFGGGLSRGTGREMGHAQQMARIGLAHRRIAGAKLSRKLQSDGFGEAAIM